MRWMRLLVAVAATLAVFGVCLWLFRFASWSWLPKATSDRWTVAAAFATVAAGVVGTVTVSWAIQGTPLPGPLINQVARASCHGQVNQAGRDQKITGK